MWSWVVRSPCSSYTLCNNILLGNCNLASNFDIAFCFLPWTYYTKTFTSYFFLFNMEIVVPCILLLSDRYFLCMLSNFILVPFMNIQYLYRVYLVNRRTQNPSFLFWMRSPKKILAIFRRINTQLSLDNLLQKDQHILKFANCIDICMEKMKMLWKKGDGDVLKSGKVKWPQQINRPIRNHVVFFKSKHSIIQ